MYPIDRSTNLNAMKLHLPQSDDLKEIVFENRNKAYGAYRLRSDYHRTLNRAMMISLLSVSLFAGILVTVHKMTKKMLPDVTREEAFVIRTIEISEPQIKPEGLPDTKPAAKPVTPPKPLEQNFDVVNQVKPADPVVVATSPNTAATAGHETGALASNTTGGSTAGSAGLPVAVMPSAPVEMASVDVAPGFPGGLEKFYTYLRGKLSFTRAAEEARLSERMYVNFVIDAEGKITLVKVLKGVGYGMDEQVVSILSKSPPWTPGIYHGQPVSTIVRLPISFQMLQ